MLKIFKRKATPKPEEKSVGNADDSQVQAKVQLTTDEKKASFFSRLKHGLKKTRTNFSSGVANLFLGKKTIDKELLEDLETALLTADVGVSATDKILAQLTDKVSRKELNDSEHLFAELKQLLIAMLKPSEQPLTINTDKKPFVILMIGVNGAGKTTTIGKLSAKFKQDGKAVMLAAGDTFRAAAIEQLQVWGERNQIPVIAAQSGADSASVIYDAMQSATAKGHDLLIADTAGRLHTQDNLMAELKKIGKVIAKLDNSAPHEILLVLDASIGQNALNQATLFHKELGVTGLAITKLDGTAKGGIIFAIADKLSLPIRYIGIGESVDDLREFNATDFVEALLTNHD